MLTDNTQEQEERPIISFNNAVESEKLPLGGISFIEIADLWRQASKQIKMYRNLTEIAVQTKEVEALQKRVRELEKYIQILELNETEMKYIISEMKNNPPE
jgi:hypothetical protein